MLYMIACSAGVTAGIPPPNCQREQGAIEWIVDSSPVRTRADDHRLAGFYAIITHLAGSLLVPTATPSSFIVVLRFLAHCCSPV